MRDLWGWLEQEDSRSHTKGGKTRCLPCTRLVLAAGSSGDSTPDYLSVHAPHLTHTLANTHHANLLSLLKHQFLTFKITSLLMYQPHLKCQLQLSVPTQVFIDASGAYHCGFSCTWIAISQGYFAQVMNSTRMPHLAPSFRAETWESEPNTTGSDQLPGSWHLKNAVTSAHRMLNHGEQQKDIRV